METLTVPAPVLTKVAAPMIIADIDVSPPKRGEVRVRMVATGVCRSCLSSAEGYFGGPPLPIVLGDEGAGVVEAVGPGCNSLAVGDHVILSWAPSCGGCRYCLAGRPQLCERTPPFGSLPDGTTRFRMDGERVFHYGPATYAPYTVVPESAAIRISSDMPLEVAALIGCSVATGVGSVTHAAGAQAGDSVAIFGCGGIGLNAVQGAHLAGAVRIIAVDVADAKLDAAASLGATHRVNAVQEDPAARIRELTGGGVDHSIIAVGAPEAVETGLKSLRPGGTCVIVGLPPDGHDIKVGARLMEAGELKLIGSAYGSMNPPVDFPRLIELYQAGRLQLDQLVSHRWTPDQANEAFDALRSGETNRGLIVFPVDD